MPRCSHCGKVNREGSLFCQDCGHRLEPAPNASKPQPAAPAGTTCSACGTLNPPGMNFCKMCGTSLAAKPAPATAATVMAEAPPPGKLNCPSCGKQTPAGFSFCQHCGQRLQPAQAPATAARAAQPAPAATPSPTAATMAQVNPTPPAGLPRTGVQAAVNRAQQAAHDDMMAKTLAPTPEVMAQVNQARAASQARMAAVAQEAPKPKIEPYKPDTLVEGKTPQKSGALVSLNRDGSDGAAVDIVGETFDIGRTEGSLNFQEDPYLAPRHARLVVQNGKVLLRSIDTVNGVYLRVQGTCELNPGDQFLVGKELIRFEAVAPEERDPPSLVEHGVRFFGSAPREAWARLRQLTVAGTTRDVWHLVRPELVLGREEGDVTFPDDEFMSRRHAAVKKVGPKARLEDLNSSNGTYVRVRGDRELKPGDVVRMGDQLMRFEQ